MKNGNQRIGRVLALATAVAALAAPAAWAAPAEQILSENTGSTTGNAQERSAQEQSYSSVNSIAPYTPQSSPSPAPVSTASDGFDWGDAGIGATVVLALAAMLGGTALVLRNRPQRGSVA
jgi:hypothetical protein